MLRRSPRQVRFLLSAACGRVSTPGRSTIEQLLRQAAESIDSELEKSRVRAFHYEVAAQHVEASLQVSSRVLAERIIKSSLQRSACSRRWTLEPGASSVSVLCPTSRPASSSNTSSQLSKKLRR